MGALYGVGIDNAIIEIDTQVPIMDGSAKNFVEKISNVGIKFSDQPIKIIKINKKFQYKKVRNLFQQINLMLLVI